MPLLPVAQIQEFFDKSIMPQVNKFLARYYQNTKEVYCSYTVHDDADMDVDVFKPSGWAGKVQLVSTLKITRANNQLLFRFAAQDYERHFKIHEYLGTFIDQERKTFANLTGFTLKIDKKSFNVQKEFSEVRKTLVDAVDILRAHMEEKTRASLHFHEIMKEKSFGIPEQYAIVLKTGLVRKKAFAIFDFPSFLGEGKTQTCRLFMDHPGIDLFTRGELKPQMNTFVETMKRNAFRKNVSMEYYPLDRFKP